METTYNYKFYPGVKELVEHNLTNGRVVSCMDYYSTDVLRGIGIKNTLMTGCPAWYYIPEIKEDKVSFCGINKVKKICLSDAGNPDNKVLEMLVIKFLLFQMERIVRICLEPY